MKKEIKSNLSELLGESTSYGLPRIFKSKKTILKIFWFIYFLIGSISTVYFLKYAVNDYLEYEIVSRIQYVSEQSMPFPAITICPTEKYNHYFDKKSLNEIIQICIFNGADCKENANNYFQRVSIYERGDCIQFNNGRNITSHSIPIINQSVPVAMGGLRISIGNIDASYYIYEPSAIYFINSGVGGIWTNYALKKYIITKENNETHRFVISKIIMNKHSTPNNPCLKDINDFPNRKIIDFIQSNNITYKKEYCYELCGVLDYIDTKPCNNTNDSLGNLNWNIDWNCFEKHLNYFKNQSLVQKCSKYCPIECDSNYYSAMVFDSHLMSNPETQIYFEDFKYTLITETGKTNNIDLVSNIGGMLSLFIGLSFVSLFEFIEIIIELFFNFFQKNKVKT